MEGLKLFLTVVSGLCWTIVYLDGIRLGFKDRSYAIPFYALALNISWELLQTIYGFQTTVTVQTVINAVWFIFDVGILFTFFRYGRKYFPASLPPEAFIVWSGFGLASAFCIEFAFIKEFGVAIGAGYSAFLQNLLMSVLFINMLVKRGSREGQSVTIAVNKWIGTLAPTILYGVLGEGGFPNGSFLILVAGTFCSIFDLLYLWLLLKTPVGAALRGRPS